MNSDLSGHLSNFKTLLCLMLNAFGLHRRNARFEADLVCCWASMCNISYPYSRDDSLARSLQKVVGAIRRRGIRLYNFTGNTEGAGLEVDLLFLDHAAFYTPRVTTLHVAGALEAALFSGAIATERHLHNAVSCREPHPAVAGAGVAVSPVANARIASLSLLSDVPASNAHFEGGVVEQWGVPGDGQERYAWGYGFALDDDGVDWGNGFSLAVVEVDVHGSNVAGRTASGCGPSVPLVLAPLTCSSRLRRSTARSFSSRTGGLTGRRERSRTSPVRTVAVSRVSSRSMPRGG